MSNYNAVDTVADISESRLYIRGLNIEKGRPYSVQFQLQMQDIVNDPTGRTFMPVDITGDKLAASVSKGTHVRGLDKLSDLIIEVIDAVEGVFELKFPSEVTEQLEVGTPYAFDVMWYNDSGYFYPIKGTLNVVHRSTVKQDVDSAEVIT